MAALDADVSDLLSALLPTALAPRALEAIEAIEAIVISDGEEGRSDGDGLAGRRWRQLEMADRVIAGGLKREILLLRRLSDLAPRFGLEDVSIVPINAEEASAPTGYSVLDPARETALRGFLDTWSDIVLQIRRRWELGDAQ